MSTTTCMDCGATRNSKGTCTNCLDAAEQEVKSYRFTYSQGEPRFTPMDFPSRIRRRIRRACRLTLWSIIGWAVYTGIFLWLEGWHWCGTHPVEVMLDRLFGILLWVGFSMWLSAVLLTTNHYLDSLTEKK